MLFKNIKLPRWLGWFFFVTGVIVVLARITIGTDYLFQAPVGEKYEPSLYLLDLLSGILFSIGALGFYQNNEFSQLRKTIQHDLHQQNDSIRAMLDQTRQTGVLKDTNDDRARDLQTLRKLYWYIDNLRMAKLHTDLSIGTTDIRILEHLDEYILLREQPRYKLLDVDLEKQLKNFDDAYNIAMQFAETHRLLEPRHNNPHLTKRRARKTFDDYSDYSQFVNLIDDAMEHYVEFIKLVKVKNFFIHL